MSVGLGTGALPAGSDMMTAAATAAAGAASLSSTQILTTIGSSVAGKAATAIVGAVMPYILGSLGFTDPVVTELRRINDSLGVIDTKLGKLVENLESLRSAMTEGFTKGDYFNVFSDNSGDVSNIHRFIRSVEATAIANKDDMEALNTALAKLFKLEDTGTAADNFVAEVNKVLDRVNPGTVSSPNDEMLTQTYIAYLRAATPFKHNVARLMDAYIYRWCQEFLIVKALVSAIYVSSGITTPENKGRNDILRSDFEAKINEVIENLKNCVPADCREAESILNAEKLNAKLFAYNFQTKAWYTESAWALSSGNTAHATMLTVILNKNGDAYHFVNTQGQDPRAHMPLSKPSSSQGSGGTSYQTNYSGAVKTFKQIGYDLKPFKLPYAPDSNKKRSNEFTLDPNTGAPFQHGWDDFFNEENSNSIVSRFVNGSRKNFNSFMQTHVSTRWWNPPFVVAGYEHSNIVNTVKTKSGFGYSTNNINVIFNERAKVLNADKKSTNNSGSLYETYESSNSSMIGYALVGVTPKKKLFLPPLTEDKWM